MHVYFVITDGCKPRMLKIGKARDVSERVADLQCACPFDLRLLGVLKCTSEKHAFKVEGDLHHAFRSFRKRGEWFFCDRSVKYAVESIIAVGRADGGYSEHLFAARNACRAEDRQVEREKRADRAVVGLVKSRHREMDREFSQIVG